jgi:hypothetical protein
MGDLRPGELEHHEENNASATRDLHALGGSRHRLRVER